MFCCFFYGQDTLIPIGRQVFHRQSEEIKEAVSTGIVDETKAVGR